jgi:hypothetical protein
MRARLFGAALLASTALLAVAPSALAQQYVGYPSGYGIYGQPTSGAQYGSGYGGGYTPSPYAGVCASLAASRATQGSAALAASPYTQICEQLGLLGSAPGAGYAAGGSWGSGSGLAAWTGLSYPGSWLGTSPASPSATTYGDGCGGLLYGASGYGYAYGTSGSYCALTEDTRP